MIFLIVINAESGEMAIWFSARDMFHDLWLYRLIAIYVDLVDDVLHEIFIIFILGFDLEILNRTT